MSCPRVEEVPHSFTGTTRVLMADGTTKTIDQIKIGDEIENAVPGTTGTQAHKVQKVIVTHTDHDFADITITPTVTKNASTQTAHSATTSARSSLRTRALTKAKLGLAALAATTAVLGLGQQTALAADHQPAPTTTAANDATAQASTLTTTYHHPFYDRTQAAFIEAEHLHAGDLLQTPTGAAEVTALRLYHANTTTYDLTINGLHTYYVLAGTAPVLVHNCGGYDLRGKDPMSIVPDEASVRELTPHSNGGSQYGLEFKWQNDAGKTVRLRIHGPDGTAPPGSNSAMGETYRLQIGRQYQDEAGNLFHHQVHNPGSPNFNPDAANATHIPWPIQFPGL